MEKTLTAILLKATDKGEYDKSVRLFCAEEGIVDATMKGVRKPKAKLKFASQPFALCEYELAEKSGRYTVTGATRIEDTYDLCLNPSLFATSAVLLEIAEKSYPSIDSKKMFVILIKALKTLLFFPEIADVVLVKFVQKVLSLSGFFAPPERTDETPDTPSKFLSYVAYKSLDELVGVTLDETLAKKCAMTLLSSFERVYETTLASKKVYKDMTK